MRSSTLTFASFIFLAACGSSEPSGGDGGTTGAGAGTTSAGGQGGDSTTTTSSGAGGSGGMGGQGAGGPEVYGFPETWNDGTNCGNEPDVHVWAYAEDTFILRQSLCSHFEGPFIYVLLGQEMVFVQDTGTGNVNLYAEVAAIAEQWAGDNGLATLPMLVTHSHGHGDHTGGDGQFSGQPDTTVFGTSMNAVSQAFGFTSWPDDVATLDLGGRQLSVLAIPGHHSAHVAVYDHGHQLLLTGDTLYPGRLYINNWSQYQQSTQRMVSFVEAGNPVSWVLGTHIELAADGNDYNFGASVHANEHVLELGYPVLVELNDAVQAMGGSPQYQAHDDFIVYP
jgi:hydroxyacylglutathione hydrolase